nr:lipocalin family protein [Bacteroides stercoris]
MSACNEKKSKDSIIGSWIMPIEGQPGKMQGIKLEEGGDASSINMATLAYKYWE